MKVIHIVVHKESMEFIHSMFVIILSLDKIFCGNSLSNFSHVHVESPIRPIQTSTANIPHHMNIKLCVCGAVIAIALNQFIYWVAWTVHGSCVIYQLDQNWNNDSIAFYIVLRLDRCTTISIWNRPIDGLAQWHRIAINSNRLMHKAHSTHTHTTTYMLYCYISDSLTVCSVHCSSAGCK